MFLDIALGILLLMGLVRGFRRGFVLQVNYVAGIVLAVMFSQPLARWAAPRLEAYLTRLPVEVRPSATYFLCAFGILLATWIIGGFALSRGRQALTGSATPTSQDRYLGAVAGIATAAVVVAILIAAIDKLPDSIQKSEMVEEQVKQSVIVGKAHQTSIAKWILDTPEVQEAIRQTQYVADYFKSKKQEPKIEDLGSELLR